jgi:hypothetical protein
VRYAASSGNSPQARPFAIIQFLSLKQDTVQIHKTKNQ